MYIFFFLTFYSYFILHPNKRALQKYEYYKVYTQYLNFFELKLTVQNRIYYFQVQVLRL